MGSLDSRLLPLTSRRPRQTPSSDRPAQKNASHKERAPDPPRAPQHQRRSPHHQSGQSRRWLFHGRLEPLPPAILAPNGSGASPTSGASLTTGATTTTMNGRTDPWATRRPPNARSKPCLFTLLATGLVLVGGSGCRGFCQWMRDGAPVPGLFRRIAHDPGRRSWKHGY